MTHLQCVLARFKRPALRGGLSKIPCSQGIVCWFTRMNHALARLPTLLHLVLVGFIVLAIVFWIGLGVWIVVRMVRTAPTSKKHQARDE